MILPDGPSLVDPNPPLSEGVGTGIPGTNGPPMAPAAPVPGTANPALTVEPVSPPSAPIALVAPWPPGFLPAEPGPAPALAEAAPASYGGNVGPVGSPQEVRQLS